MMLLDCIWADGDFVQATAWFLSHEIWIFDTGGTKQHPYMKDLEKFNNFLPSKRNDILKKPN